MVKERAERRDFGATSAPGVINVAVVGAGPVGYLTVLDTLIRYNILTSNKTLSLYWVVRDPSKRESLKKNGLRFQLTHNFPPEVLEKIADRSKLERGLQFIDSIERVAEITNCVGLVIACVKAYSIAEVLVSARTNLPEARILVIANGLLDFEDALLGVQFGGGTVVDGELRLSKSHKLEYGSLDRTVRMLNSNYKSLLADKITQTEISVDPVSDVFYLHCFFRKKGFIWTYTGKDIFPTMLSKVITNSVINPLTAIFDMPNSVILEPKLVPLVQGLVSEICEVLNASRADFLPWSDLPGTDFHDCEPDITLFRPDTELARIIEVARNSATNISSMLQDVRAGRQTEIPWLNGKIVELGKKYGLRTPLNEWAVTVVGTL